jgi:hypothetical protein
MKYQMNRGPDRKIFGGTNFIIVMWTLLSIFRMAVALEEGLLSAVMAPEFLAFIIPLIFLIVLNVLMGIASFFPQKNNHMWILSLIIVTFTLITFNTFQTKVDEMREAHALEQQLLRF